MCWTSPRIGLHQRDNGKLLESLKGLRDMGNTVIVVEHDEDAIRTADHVIDMGPGAGIHGGHIIAEGTPADIMANKKSLTGKYLTGAENIPIPGHAPQGRPQSLAESGGRARQQSEKCHGADSARHAHLRHRRFGRRQIHPHHRDAVQGGGAQADPGARASRAA